ncbi:nucleotidyltransferase family protein [Gracilibacillus marinus]|uniref:Nucleotidyltransferase family protein n=1 Tax=Gracilibacillus marinus TaxID=630535 RepID=A0ABV8VQ40_9BACI
MDLQEIFVSRDEIIKNAIKKLDQTAKKILLVVEKNKLQGIVTDGDIRRWILKNGDLNDTVERVMNQSPKYVNERESYRAKEILESKMIEAIPVVDDYMEVKDIIFWNDRFQTKRYHNSLKNPVVIMAGGKGTRLAPYTKIIPKPLIPIGETPIVERIINRFHEFGCQSYYMTVNYKKNMIRAYFEDLEKDYTVDYVEETKPLGTAGSLYMLKNQLKDTFFVSNCDILIDGNYADMMKYHKESNNKITLITSLKHYTIPYGIVKLDEDSKVKEMMEKPEYDYLVNTGMYILEASCLDDIPEEQFFHITDLINLYIRNNEKVGVYPVSENSWLDMGEFKEMEKMMEKLGVK